MTRALVAVAARHEGGLSSLGSVVERCAHIPACYITASELIPELIGG